MNRAHGQDNEGKIIDSPHIHNRIYVWATLRESHGACTLDSLPEADVHSPMGRIAIGSY